VNNQFSKPAIKPKQAVAAPKSPCFCHSKSTASPHLQYPNKTKLAINTKITSQTRNQTKPHDLSLLSAPKTWAPILSLHHHESIPRNHKLMAPSNLQIHNFITKTEGFQSTITHHAGGSAITAITILDLCSDRRTPTPSSLHSQDTAAALTV
jgi:hypothetical protein